MPEIVLEQRYGAVQKAVIRGLIAYNRAAVGRRPWKTLAVSVREDDEIRGGVIGEVWYGWLFVKLFWLDESLRNADLGSAALGRLEDEARRLGATRAYVDTFSFQAPGFYRKLGYRDFGKLDGYPEGHSRFWLTKVLGPEQAEREPA
jgi:GNAT superfamily N-acetyltransferase